MCDKCVECRAICRIAWPRRNEPNAYHSVGVDCLAELFKTKRTRHRQFHPTVAFNLTADRCTTKELHTGQTTGLRTVLPDQFLGRARTALAISERSLDVVTVEDFDGRSSLGNRGQ